MTWQSPLALMHNEMSAFYVRSRGHWDIPLDNLWQTAVLATHRKDPYVAHMPLGLPRTAHHYLDRLTYDDFTYQGNPLIPHLPNSIVDERVIGGWHTYPDDSVRAKSELTDLLNRLLPPKSGHSDLVHSLGEATANYAAAIDRSQLRFAVRVYSAAYEAVYGPHTDLPTSDVTAAFFLIGRTTWQKRPTGQLGLQDIYQDTLPQTFASGARRYGQTAMRSFSMWPGLQEHAECPVQGQMRLAIFIFVDAGYRTPAIQLSARSRAYGGYGYSR